MPKVVFVLLVLLSCVAPRFTQGQDIKFYRYGVDEGLSNNNVEDLLEDQYGFIWIATEDGLNVFDGYAFTTFRKIKGDTSSLSDNRSRCLFEDHLGYIWSGALNGVNRYDHKTKNFRRYAVSPEDGNSLVNEVVNHIIQDRKGNLWLGTENGISIYNHNSDNFSNIKVDKSNPSSFHGGTILDMAEDHQGRIWIATSDGLRMTPDLGNTFINYGLSYGNQSISSTNVRSIHVDRNNRLWLGHLKTGLDIIDLTTNKVSNLRHNPNDPNSLSDNYVTSIAEAADGSIWITTDHGLNFYQENNTFVTYENEASNDFSLSSDIIRTVLTDRNKNLWAATRLGGISKGSLKASKFSLITHQPGDDSSLTSNYTAGFAESSNGLLAIATDGGGVNFFDKTTNTYKSIQHEAGNRGSLPTNKVLALEFDGSDDLWIGMWSGGVSHYNLTTKQLKHYGYENNNHRSLAGNSVFDIFRDKDGQLWIAFWEGGLSKYNPETDDFSSYFNSRDTVYDIRTETVNKMNQDKDGNYWIVSEFNGIFKFNEKTGETRHYPALDEYGNITKQYMYAILIDSQDRIWVGTGSYGLGLLNPDTGEFKYYTKSDGLPNDGVMGILEDDEGILWISTNKGISRFDPTNLSFKNFDKSDGLQSDHFMPRNSIKLSTGELLFGGNGGFNQFLPEQIKENQTPPAIYITNFQLFNKPVKIGPREILKENISTSSEITLQYNQNFFTLEYVGLNFQHSEKNQYRYIMEGLQNEWVEAGYERKASFTGVDPGTYTFKVMASNNDGVWNPKPTVLVIHVIPAPWQTSLAYTFYILIILSLIILIFYWRLSSLRKRRVELAEEVREKTKELREAHDQLVHSEKMASLGLIAAGMGHEINNPLNYIKNGLEGVQMELQKSEVTYPQKVNSYFGIMDQGISRVAAIVKSLSHFSRIGKDNSEMCNVEEILGNCLVLLSNKAKQVNIETEFLVGKKALIRGNEGKLHQAFLNILSNGLQATSFKGNLFVGTSLADGHYRVSVKDDGEGIPEENIKKIDEPFFTTKSPGEGTGLGLFITYSIIRAHRGKVEVLSKLNEGAEFIINLPYQENKHDESI